MYEVTVKFNDDISIIKIDDITKLEEVLPQTYDEVKVNRVKEDEKDE